MLGDRKEVIEKAKADLQRGKFVLIYDDDKREGETDIVMASEFVKPPSIKTMRKDGGGLIFIMISHSIANKLQLPFLSDLFSVNEEQYPVFKHLVPNDIPYDTKSSFSVYINHRDTYTGITDIDRSLTMKNFAELAKKINNIDTKESLKIFGKGFRSPGHVPICVSAENLLDERQGHTELVVSLLIMANLTPVGSGCEMMGENGKALSKQDAIDYAKDKDLVFIEGKDIKKAWNKWSR
jgi:3,4-dihydroxy 2-butanone 4-phosphate synthase